jgi:putative flippase GtrA
VIFSNPKERERFLKFAVVGIFGAVVDFGIFNLLVSFTPVPAVIASMISFSCAVVSNFLWNRYWTYPDSRSKKITHQVVQFAIINVIGLIIRTPLFAFLEKQLTILAQRVMPAKFFLTPTFLGHNTALAIAVLVVMIWNFLANRFWTYNDVSS